MNCQDLHYIENIQWMPVRANKQPIVKEWQLLDRQHDLSDCEAVGIVCGMLSKGIEVIDVDVKYDITGKMWDEFKKAIHAEDDKLLNKLVVQKTRGGGYHLIYRCKKIQGNTKLARRPTTEGERGEAYRLAYDAELKKSSPEEKARSIAENAAKDDKLRVLFETRGEGGYIVCFPSPGYEIIHGDFYSISEITEVERNLIFDIARSFNSYFDAVPIPKTFQVKKQDGLSPWEDYNERGDVVALLQEHGWTVVKQKGVKTLMLRPGHTTSDTSGNYDSQLNWFSVFSTSTEFEAEKAYKPFAVYAKLEFQDDFKAAAKKLSELGYGDKKEQPKKESTRIIQSRVNPQDNDYSFLATPLDYDGYLQQVIDGTLPVGKSWGIPSLDEHFLLKDGKDEGGFVNINGHDNVGKTAVIIYLALLSALFYGWVWQLYCSENSIGAIMRKLIQFYWGKPINGQYAMSKEEYAIAKTFAEKHFLFIKTEEDMFNYKDIINMTKKVMSRYPINAALIDPYNSLKIDLSGFSKLSTHEYHYEAMSEIKFFGKKNNVAMWINHHAVTAALRAKDGEKKYPIAPNKADTEGGGKVPNKSDDFLTIHRKTQHPTEWMITEIHVRKIKETETGGRPTPIDQPVKLEMYKGGTAFIEKLEDVVRVPIDPIFHFHAKHRSNDLRLEEAKVFRPHWTDNDWKSLDGFDGFPVN